MKHLKSFRLIKESNERFFYNFKNMPGEQKWISDNDISYNDDFFNDKEYDEYEFDNFKEMDSVVGHSSSLFGTRGLEPGDPNRTSRSFDMYNSRYGPCLVRALK